MTPCANLAHPKFDAGEIEVCFLCHFRTDLAFAVYSQQLLQRIKDEDQPEMKEAA